MPQVPIKNGEAIIPQGTKIIEDYAFRCCRSLYSITIPDSVTYIGESAFDSCESLISITIPDSVTRIGDKAFRYCKILTSITIPDSVTSIGDCAFLCCKSLTSITIPDSVTSIGEYAFFECSSLTSIIIPEGTTEHFKKILPKKLHDLLKEVEVKNRFDFSQVYDGPQYHCVLAGQSFGPVTISQFTNMKRFGIVDGNTLVWKEGMANWAIASTVADLQILI